MTYHTLFPSSVYSCVNKEIDQSEYRTMENIGIKILT